VIVNVDRNFRNVVTPNPLIERDHVVKFIEADPGESQ